MALDAGSRSPATEDGWRLRHFPVGVSLVVFGGTRVASLLDWSSRHRDAARMLGVGDGATTALLGVSAVAELLLTVAAVLAVGRRRAVWLLVALAGWLLEFLVLAVVAGVAGDGTRLAEHGVFLLVFGGRFPLSRCRRSPASPRPAPLPRPNLRGPRRTPPPCPRPNGRRRTPGGRRRGPRAPWPCRSRRRRRRVPWPDRCRGPRPRGPPYG